MADDKGRRSPDEETEAERAMRARVHRHMGTTATLLVLVAVGVALARMQKMFGVSILEALGIGASGLGWILLILGLGVVFSLGTTRLLQGVEKLIALVRGWLGKR